MLIYTLLLTFFFGLLIGAGLTVAIAIMMFNREDNRIDEIAEENSQKIKQVPILSPIIVPPQD